MKHQAVSVCGALVLVGGCVIQVPGVLDAGGDEDTVGDGDEPMDTGAPDPEPDPDPDPPSYPGPTDGDGCAQALDILVVLDNSGSMGTVQRRLADSMPLLIDGLDQAGVEWRLAFTTTDNGNIWCGEGTSMPESGHFVFSPCTSRLGDFVHPIGIDTTAIACTDICSLDPAQLEPFPTYTEQDGLMKSRPWLQRENGQLNVAAADAKDAIRCLLPQGINGCGLEQPLESMWLGLARTTLPAAPETGFLRADASLLVVLVTDEADCSTRPEFEEDVFGPDGERVFWSDPNQAAPSSAVCWNAGVECFGDPSGYDDCVAAHKDIHGDPSTPADAVMFPVNRYKNKLAQIELDKRAISGGEGLDVAVLAITGIGLGGTFTYATASDPVYQASFGIGPGCEDMADPESGGAVPPVRIREVAEHLTTQPFGSVCAPDFDQHMLGALEHFVGGC